MRRRVFGILALLACVLSNGVAGDTLYVPGQTYFGRNQYIEYYAGNLPYILSAPHGGQETPAEIPDRTYGTTTYDTHTQETARAFIDSVVARTGKHPHVIICRLARIKLDANRDSLEGAQGNPYALQAWQEWHHFIEVARESIVAQYGKGLYVDLHGHGHTIQRLELGYNLSASQLRLPDDSLNLPAQVYSSSIRTLAGSSPEHLSGLLRGPRSLGTYFENRGFRAVPSTMQPSPGADPYFTGGFDTERHGSLFGGPIDGVQIETNYSGVRDTEPNYRRYAGALAEVFDYYTAWHHLGETTAPPSIVLNEVMFDVTPDDTGTPQLEGDANGDGVRSPRGDEFIEIVNTGPAVASLAGVRILERDMKTVFTFPDTALLESGQYAVVFGGVGPNGFGASIPSSARLYAARPGYADSGFAVSASKTNLLGAGDNVVLFEPRSNQVFGEISWGGYAPRTAAGAKLVPPNTLLGDSIAGAIGQSVTRKPDLTGLWTKSLSVTTLPYSPGAPAITDVASDRAIRLPGEFALLQNYPNPFNPSTLIRYAVGNATSVRVAVFDILGRTVAVLADGRQEAGTYTVSFNAQGLPAGVYFCTMRAGAWSFTCKMMLVR